MLSETLMSAELWNVIGSVFVVPVAMVMAVIYEALNVDNSDQHRQDAVDNRLMD